MLVAWGLTRVGTPLSLRTSEPYYIALPLKRAPGVENMRTIHLQFKYVWGTTTLCPYLLVSSHRLCLKGFSSLPFTNL